MDNLLTQFERSILADSNAYCIKHPKRGASTEPTMGCHICFQILITEAKKSGRDK